MLMPRSDRRPAEHAKESPDSGSIQTIEFGEVAVLCLAGCRVVSMGPPVPVVHSGAIRTWTMSSRR
ncbi:hypothetical protein [Nocardia flavorosea]|uniref:hypothetical protein n=1 Tax=Nocardia flavorosea TaxID=53429 RepID=UPI002456DE04|nr:hypothetical protein [Nocardia flavorosea]